MSGQDFGGVMRLTDSAGATVALRGTFTISPSATSAEAITNQDGSVDRIISPVHPAAEITIADKGVDIVALFDGARRNVTIVEQTTGRLHMFTGAFMIGRPQVNALTGEVTGLTIAAASYRRVGGAS